MGHRRKRKERSKVDKNIKELSETEEYDSFRMLLFQTAERIKEIIKAKGFDVGEIKDCAPLFQFRYKKCKSEKIAAYIYTNTVALVCVECNTMEVVGDPNEIE
ncbi:MAG: hypothetical protein SVM80_04310 [Halobacteriota archaeon]|nr:hypothetical protein [Halobacteriota archaeon]